MANHPLVSSDAHLRRRLQGQSLGNQVAASSERRTGRRLQRRRHTAFEGTPYLDPDLNVPHSKAHRIMVQEIGPVLGMLASEAGLAYLSDEPIWFADPDTNKQKVHYGDLVLAQPVDTRSITAEDLLLVMEVVTTSERRKEVKDTRFQLALNEYNGVPEFALAFPDLKDERALLWYRLVGRRYEESIVAPGGEVESAAVPGLGFRVKPQGQWQEGRKLEVIWHGERCLALQDEHERAEQENCTRSLGPRRQ